MTFTDQFLDEARRIADQLDVAMIEKAVQILADTREQGGRLFILGVGGSAGNASHAVNDFRKIVGLESYAPTDNVSELTARTNDEGWATVFEAWLRGSRLSKIDALLILSVGGGDVEKSVSPNLVAALKLAKHVGAKVIGIVGRNGGYTAQVADACVIVPTVNPNHVTPHTEAFQAVVWHLFVSHPKLKQAQTKWESVAPAQTGTQCAVFLDRDGVINKALRRNGKPYPPENLEQLEIDADAPLALAALKEKGFRLVVVTNQPDVGRGNQRREIVEEINGALATALPLDRILVCYHTDEDKCECRKPMPGLLLQAARDLEIDLKRSFMIGDRGRDIEAGHSAGCQTIFIDYGYQERRSSIPPDATVKSLREAVTWILRMNPKGAQT